MSAVSSSYLAGLLKKTGLFSDEQMAALIEAKKGSESSITELVVKQGVAQEEVFLEAVGKAMNIPFIKLGAQEIAADVLDKLPTKAVFQYNVMPVYMENGALVVVSSDPLNTALVDTLRIAAGMRVRIAFSVSEEISKAAKRFYGVGAETVDKMMKEDRFDVLDESTSGKIDVNELDQEASIVKFVNQIIWEACQQGATDIHFEPMEDELRIRYRVDGVLHQAPVPSQLNRFQAAIISRIKVMANLDIAEKRMPMDGRIGLKIQGQDVDIRVSTMPTVYGESVSLRLLKGRHEFIGLPELGMAERDAKIIQKVLQRPNGIVLVTGPTGSGKSTSLYAYLHELNKMDVRILTAEEPIEYEMTGVNQVLVRTDIGLTFARVLRSFLRQDPDIIMVGEIRDKETAEIAIQASLTGHLVFSTLHTNDSAGAFTRLLDMGVEPYLAASAVVAVVGQRLVRKLCPACKKPVKPDELFLREAGFPMDKLAGGVLYGEQKCEKCRMTGFRGRGGIFEVLQMTEAIESLVIKHSPTSEIKQKSLEEGMTSLRDDGWKKVLAGYTTVDEILRVSEEDD